jgi:hypothetical protein
VRGLRVRARAPAGAPSAERRCAAAHSRTSRTLRWAASRRLRAWPCPSRSARRASSSTRSSERAAWRCVASRCGRV